MQASADKCKVGICALEQAIAKLQHEVVLAEAKVREAAAAMRQAEQAEKAASDEAKAAALLHKLKAEVAAQREAEVFRKIREDFDAACKAYKDAIGSAGTDGPSDAPPAGKAGVPAETGKVDRNGQSRSGTVRRGRVDVPNVDQPPVSAWPVAAFDGFDGRLALAWTPIRRAMGSIEILGGTADSAPVKDGKN
jgi:hypothetical protein